MELLEALRGVYGERIYADEIANLDDAQLIELSENLKKGVPIATPVFDGARMSDIEGMLTRAGLDTSGQVVLTDGRTGEPFERRPGRKRACTGIAQGYRRGAPTRE